MEVDESEWLTKARGNIDKYLNRGGPGKGDEPQFLDGCNLLNFIGFAMGLPEADPAEFIQIPSKLKKASEGDLCFYTGDSRRAIDVIADRIVEKCEANLITVLPIEIYLNGKLYEVPLFRVQRDMSSSAFFVDNVGHSYDSFSDWKDHNVLPPCRMLYPANGRLEKHPSFEYSNCFEDDTTSNRGASVWLMSWVSKALQLVVNFADETLPLLWDNSTRRMLGVAANIVSFEAMGASMRLTRSHASEALQLVVNIANGTNPVVSGVAIENFDDMSPADVLLQVMAIDFWTKREFTYKTGEQYRLLAIKNLSQNMSLRERQNFVQAKIYFDNDQRVLRAYHVYSRDNIMPQWLLSEFLSQATLFGGTLNEEGLLVIGDGHTISLEMANMPIRNRAEMFRTIGAFPEETSGAFKSLRTHLGDDLQLVRGLFEGTAQSNVTRQNAVESVLKLWNQVQEQPVDQQNAPFVVNENSVAIGRNELVYSNKQLVDFTPQNRAFVFVGYHLIRLTDNQKADWHQIATSMNCTYGQLMNWIKNNHKNLNCLLRLVSCGLFQRDICPVTSLVDYGNSVLEANKVLRVSVVRLSAILDAIPKLEDQREVLQLVSQIPTAATPTEKTIKPTEETNKTVHYQSAF